MLKAVIFDLDGVVADSHPIHEAAWKALLAEQGLDPATINLDFLYAGQPRREIVRHFLGALPDDEVQALGRRKDELYGKGAEKLAPKPGLLRVLDELAYAGIVMAVATSAGGERTVETLEHFGIAGRFSVVVTGNDVLVAKPAPDIFLLTASRLGVAPNESVVVEDSVAGVAAARAAGMACVGYAPPSRHAELRDAGADDAISEFPPHAEVYFRRVVESVSASSTRAGAKIRAAAPPSKGA
ncbi:MAG: HAD family phosphatase [Candidatus Acidiferrales bacterium]